MDLFPAVAPGELWTFIAGLLLAGLAAGVIAGLLGVGGGIVLVPVLYHTLAGIGVGEEVRMHVAVATSLATIMPTSISSVLAHDRRGAVDRDLLKRWMLPMGAGVLAGSALAGLASGWFLTLLFAVVALPLSIHMGFAREGWRLADALPRGPASYGIAASIGGLSAMMGVGGGTFGTITMTLCGVPIHRAIATSAGFGVLISIPGTVGLAIAGWNAAGLPPYSLGYVSLIGFALLAPVTALAAPLGAHLAHATDRVKLKRIFAAFIALTALRMLWEVIS